jgi:hypothetical protein
LNAHHHYGTVRSRERSAADRIVAVLGQSEGVIAADVKLNVSVARHSAVIEGVVLVEVAEGVDAGIPVVNSASVVGDDAVAESVVRGIILKADAVTVGAPLFLTVRELKVFHRAAVVLKGRPEAKAASTVRLEIVTLADPTSSNPKAPLPRHPVPGAP